MRHNPDFVQNSAYAHNSPILAGVKWKPEYPSGGRTRPEQRDRQIVDFISRSENLNIISPFARLTSQSPSPTLLGLPRVSKADRDDKNLEAQLYEFDKYGLRRDLIFDDDETGTTFKRPGWKEPKSAPSMAIPSPSCSTGSARTSTSESRSRRT